MSVYICEDTGFKESVAFPFYTQTSFFLGLLLSGCARSCAAGGLFSPVLSGVALWLQCLGLLEAVSC